MKPIPGESENRQRKHLVSDPFLKEYFQLKQEPKDSFQHFRQSFQSQLFQHTRRGKTTKRTCTDQFYALSQQCYEANQNFESKLVVETAKEDEINTKKSIRTPSLLTRQLSKGKLTPRSNNAKSSPYLATDEDVGLDSRGRFRFIHGNVKLLADILTQNQYQQLHSISNINNNYSITNQPCDLIWSCSHVRSHLLGFLPYYQKINFFPHSYECTRKDSLARNMNTLMQIFGQKHFSFMPECFIWPKEKDQLRQTMRGTGSSSSPLKPTMISRKRQKLQKMRGEFGFETTKPLIPWIVKPSSRSQGKGIFIVTSYEEIETRLHVINEEKESYIVERYINNPLLIYGKKFDLRIYVLVTSFDPLKIYIHRDGLVRRASEKYDPSNFSNRFSHLTNYSVNKRHSQWSHSASPLTVEEKPDSHEERKHQRLKSLYEYSMMIDGMKIDFKLDDIPGEIDFLDDASPRRRTHDEYDTEVNSDLEEVDLRTKNSFDGSYLQQEERDGSSYSTVNDSYNENEHKDRFGLKMSFSDLNQWFQENNIDVDLIWRKIEDLVIKTLIVTEGKINAAMNVSPINPDCCFELFGFDVLIDNELNPWLMEVNFAPSLSTDSRLDYEVKGQMLLDLLNVIGLKKDFKKESAKNTEGNEKSVLPSTWKVPSSRDETDESSFRNRSSMSFHFKGKFQGQVVPFHQAGGEYKAVFEDELFGNEKAKEEEKMVAESLVQYFYQKDLTNPQDRQILNQFLQEKERCCNSRFQLIFPANSTFPIYAKFFLEQRKFNLVIGRFEFFLLEYEKFLKQHEGRNGLLTPDHTAHHLLRKARSVGASNTGTTKLLQIPVNRQVLPRPRSSSSSNIRLRKEEAKSFNYGILSEEVLTQIHARWAKAMGISTKSF